jgi:hypothetical protein
MLEKRVGKGFRGGLLTLMMLARLGSTIKENDYLEHQMCKEVFSEACPNPITDSHQNLAAFLFGITMDNVMKWCEA